MYKSVAVYMPVLSNNESCGKNNRDNVLAFSLDFLVTFTFFTRMKFILYMRET